MDKFIFILSVFCLIVTHFSFVVSQDSQDLVEAKRLSKPLFNNQLEDGGDFENQQDPFALLPALSKENKPNLSSDLRNTDVSELQATLNIDENDNNVNKSRKIIEPSVDNENAFETPIPPISIDFESDLDHHKQVNVLNTSGETNHVNKDDTYLSPITSQTDVTESENLSEDETTPTSSKGKQIDTERGSIPQNDGQQQRKLDNNSEHQQNVKDEKLPQLLHRLFPQLEERQQEKTEQYISQLPKQNLEPLPKPNQHVFPPALWNTSQLLPEFFQRPTQSEDVKDISFYNDKDNDYDDHFDSAVSEEIEDSYLDDKRDNAANSSNDEAMRQQPSPPKQQQTHNESYQEFPAGFGLMINSKSKNIVGDTNSDEDKDIPVKDQIYDGFYADDSYNIGGNDEYNSDVKYDSDINDKSDDVEGDGAYSIDEKYDSDINNKSDDVDGDDTYNIDGNDEYNSEEKYDFDINDKSDAEQTPEDYFGGIKPEVDGYKDVANDNAFKNKYDDTANDKDYAWDVDDNGEGTSKNKPDSNKINVDDYKDLANDDAIKEYMYDSAASDKDNAGDTYEDEEISETGSNINNNDEEDKADVDATKDYVYSNKATGEDYVGISDDIALEENDKYYSAIIDTDGVTADEDDDSSSKETTIDDSEDISVEKDDTYYSAIIDKDDAEGKDATSAKDNSKSKENKVDDMASDGDRYDSAIFDTSDAVDYDSTDEESAKDGYDSRKSKSEVDGYDGISNIDAIEDDEKSQSDSIDNDYMDGEDLEKAVEKNDSDLQQVLDDRNADDIEDSTSNDSDIDETDGITNDNKNVSVFIIGAIVPSYEKPTAMLFPTSESYTKSPKKTSEDHTDKDEWFEKESMEKEDYEEDGDESKEGKRNEESTTLGEHDSEDDDDDEYYITKWTHYDDSDVIHEEWDGDDDDTEDDTEDDFDESKDQIADEIVDELAKKSKQPTAPTSMVLFYTWMIVAVLIIIVGISTYQSRCRRIRFPGTKTASNPKDDKKRLIEHEFV